MSSELQANNLDLDTALVLSKLIEADDSSTVKDLTHLFNVNLSKKSALRIQKFNELLDSVTDQMSHRLQKRGDEFSNSDLITYLKVIQESLDKSTKTLNQVDETPIINLNQTNNSVNVKIQESPLDRDARERILSVVSGYLKHLQTDKPCAEPIIQLDETQYTEETESQNDHT